MRRFITTISVVGLLGAGAAAALAVVPATNTFFTGSAGNFQNQNGSWSRSGTATFQLSTSGKFYTGVKKYYVYVKSLRGNYKTTCNGVHHVGAKFLKVNANGAWGITFVDHGAHVRIWGTFSARNRTSVNYVVNFHGSGTTPSGLNSSCASWVHGFAHS
jgi:hypothetical protein